jgi:hypothetical protein
LPEHKDVWGDARYEPCARQPCRTTLHARLEGHPASEGRALMPATQLVASLGMILLAPL